MEGLPRVREFYREERILITGGSGFLGKLLVEKLLRSCPDLGKIYLLLRPSRRSSRTSPQERWRQISEESVFARLKREGGSSLLQDKVQVLEGDIGKTSLGLSTQDLTLIQESVTVIFHVAATVRFDEPLPRAVLFNVKGTLELINIALGTHNIKAVVHVSTTFCNWPLEQTAERVYPPADDWRTVIAVAEALPSSQLAILQNKILKEYKNTYVYTKQLAESIVYQYKDILPVIIMRPAIVVYSKSEPEPGWVENFNGPIGLKVAAWKGLIRAGPMEKRARRNPQPFVCADETIQALILGPWNLKLHGRSGEVFNVTSTNTAIAHPDILGWADIILKSYPSEGALWYPSDPSSFYSSKTFRIQAVIFHFIPALIVDALLKFFRQKPVNLLKIQIQIHKAFLALRFFMNRPWDFPNDNYQRLCRSIHPLDLDDFGSSHYKLDCLSINLNGWRVALKHLLKEDIDKEDHFEKAIQKRKRLYWLDRLLKASLFCFLGYVINGYLDIANCLGITGPVFEVSQSVLKMDL